MVVIESGHGLQPIWRAGSPPGDSNVIGRDRSRDEWKTICRRCGTAAQTAARQATGQDIHIDNVFDLVRVLRCPGSVNWKNPDDPVPVRTRLAGPPAWVLARDLVARMERDNIAPLARVRPEGTGSRPTTWGEATAWIAAQPGAAFDTGRLRRLGHDRALN